jgi:uncharacterized membrane protein YdbT with pleckstrin-like domain
MAQENGSPEEQEWVEPEGIIMRQVRFAWFWASAPWLIGFLIVSMVVPELAITEPVTATVILVVIIVPRYFVWRRTRYTIADEYLVYQRGGIMSARAYPLPWWRISDVQTKYGMFGRAIGYKSVNVMMNNGAIASMSYLPMNSDAEELVREKIDAAEPPPDAEMPDDEPGSEDAGDDSPGSSGDSDASKYDPDAPKYDPDKG